MRSKLLFVQPSLDAVGGIEKVVPTVAAELSNRGYETSAVTFYGSIPITQTFWAGRYEFGESTSRHLWHKVSKVFLRARFIRKSLRETRADYVIVSAQGAIVIMILLRFLGLIKVPVIAYIHEARGDGGSWYRAVTGLVYPLADGWIGVSVGICEEIKRLPGVERDKVMLAYNSVAPAPVPDEALREALGVVSGLERPIFINAGRFEITKGSDILVDAFLGYAKNHRGTLLMLGSGSLEPELKKRVKEANLDGRVWFLGHVGHPRAYMSHANLYVSCARSEPFGLAIIEALSVGLPVVATDVPSGPREILSPAADPDGYPSRTPYGVLMAPPVKDPVANTEALTESIESALERSFEPKELRSRAGEFSLKNQLTAIERLLDIV